MTAALSATSANKTIDLGPAVELVSKEEGHRQPLAPEFVSAEDFSPLEVAYDFGRVRREDIEAGPRNIWRYKKLLPVPSTVEETPNTEPGCTRLVRADRLAKELGLKRVWVKDDTGNPTHSFKDRVVAVALAAAREFGFEVLACPSTGNLANATAAAAARAGWRSVVLIPKSLERAKILTTAVYDGDLIAVDGNYDDVNRLATELAAEHPKWAFVNVNVRPYYSEGSKTLAYEVAEQLGWRIPEQIVVPIASGSQLTKVDKGFRELGQLGLVDASPYQVFGAQATGCSPVSAAYRNGHDVVQPVKPDTIARSLAIGNPADGPYVLDVVNRTGGAIEDVTDEEVVEGIRLLARTEGIFTETAGGVTVATAKKLVETGKLDPDAETVLLITGDGLKTLDAVENHIGPKATVPPSAEAVAKALGY
ncbi:threonine synthase [Amycolatopsis rubida]|uniref:Threonine synthase n=1 Tax=Amycolatopsis rubida TaxID=112413 RepID=A0A1I5Z288_9PSEU|nr:MULTISPECIES: threonine synthase [Amycolatopsis]MYW96889.1 threonine synthase [Amycolatopsis rubida]NEC61874.1 threonine synthase [Amycolatopsis rubida]OAP23637.1 Threonine synthase [Amycolatopsis sp. M39]SFQ50549.1 threonine synthase [Amycolatopsis rubida]